jgi:hypothetical protein
MKMTTESKGKRDYQKSLD